MDGNRHDKFLDLVRVKVPNYNGSRVLDPYFDSKSQKLRQLKVLEVRGACTTAQRHREYNKNEFEYWCVKSSIPVPCADPNLQCDSIVIIMLKMQFLFTCKLHDLREFTPYVGGTEVYEWLLDQPLDQFHVVQVFRIEDTFKYPLSRQHLSNGLPESLGNGIGVVQDIQDDHAQTASWGVMLDMYEGESSGGRGGSRGGGTTMKRKI
jgi:hypothetical protein